MNVGIISSRYAAALLKFVAGTSHEDLVYSQVCVLENSLRSLPQLRYLIDNPMAIPDERKFSLLTSALGEENMAEELEKFIRLVMKKKRTKYLRFILLSFIDQYRDVHCIRLSKLVTAVPAPQLEKRISRIVSQTTGDKVLFEHKIDPEIIGGFIFEIDGYRLDASTAAQLNTIRRQFIEKNRRIV